MPRLFPALPAAVIALILPSAGFADDLLDRFRAVSEESNTVIMGMMLTEIGVEGAQRAELEALIPDMTWDGEMLTAGECILAEYREKVSDAQIADMLTGMEDFLAQVGDLASLDDLTEPEAFLPDGLSSADIAQISVECGMIAVQSDRMEESGFMDAMMQAAMDANP